MHVIVDLLDQPDKRDAIARQAVARLGFLDDERPGSLAGSGSPLVRGVVMMRHRLPDENACCGCAAGFPRVL
jgi:hypothetical protein